MDYCHACRRHLNGALACAGCGTPVERLRYDTPHALSHPAPHEGAEAPEPYPTGMPYAAEPYGYAPEPHLSEPYASEPYTAEEVSPREPLAPEHVYELDLVVPPRPAGRAAGRAAERRRKRGRSGRGRSGRGRTVAVSALGLVLAAGSLGLAKAVFEEPEEKGPANAVEELDVTETPLPPALPTRSPGGEPTGTTKVGNRADGASAAPATSTGRPRWVSAESGGGSTASPASGSGQGSGQGPGGGSGTGTGPGAGTGSGSGTGTGTGSGEGSGQGGTPTGRPSSATPSSPAPSVPEVTAGPQDEGPGSTPSATGSPTAPATGTASPSATASPRSTTATPTPEPSETCTRFLWWCV
ncbi:hypothetical protein [Streptomyces sp. NPDC058486]|uniref:SCO2400 family protein n=1 Tax=unclassified Streptomyces TaxID=2593676 RepID=UPI0036642910